MDSSASFTQITPSRPASSSPAPSRINTNGGGEVGAPSVSDNSDPTSYIVEQMWSRADDMMFEERGDRDMTKDEVQEYLSNQPNPFKALPPDHADHVREAVSRGDLETLKNMENVCVYQTFHDQHIEQAKARGEYVEDDGSAHARYDGQVVLNAKEIWEHFDELRKLRQTHLQNEEIWNAELAKPKWKTFVRWYPTIAGYAATPNCSEDNVNFVRMMLEQKHRQEHDAAYTRAHADAAMEMYNQNEALKKLPPSSLRKK